MSHYKAFDHQHLGEINQSVNQLQADYANELILYRTEEILQEEFCNSVYYCRRKFRRFVAKYEAFIKTNLRNRYHYDHQHETSSANK
jgi:N-acetyl-gamma-glutamyl-phosphate reductase